MAELKDYSGPFNPDLRFEDFSKETLVKLLKEYSRLYLILHGSWHTLVRERFGDRANIDLDCYQWMVSAPANAHWLARALKIQPENVESYFKALQVDPAFPLALFDLEYELVTPDHGFMTCKRCTALDAYEAEGRGHEVPMCHEEEPATFAYAALYHHPKMVIRPVKLPPRTSKDEIACKWECKIEPTFSPTDSLTRASLREQIFAKTRTSGAADANRLGASREWTEDMVRKYWSLLPDDTKAVMRLIAKNPAGYLKDDLVKELGIVTEELSHRFGYVYLPFFVADFPPLEHPARILTDPWRYEMNQTLAREIIRLGL
jgi:hypothetical protein